MSKWLGALCLLLGSSSLLAECDAQLLVSGFNSDNVHIFDLCSGTFDRNLDTAGRLDGPQAVRVANGYIYVASEQNDRIVRYDAQTLAFIDIFAETGAIGVSAPTGLAVGADGDLYVGSFRTSTVARVDGETGALVQRYDLGGLVAGIDAGMAFNADGRLLVPGFDSDNVVAVDVGTGNAGELIAPGTGGLSAPRVIVLDEARERLLVSGWRSNRVLSFRFDGSFVEELVTTAGPTGVALEPDGNILVTSDQLARVVRYGSDGASLGTVLEPGAGGVDGATFLVRLGDEGTASIETQPDQAWLIGVGELAGGTLVAEMVVTDGAAFGADFDPATVRRQAWGSIEFTLVDCSTADFAWSSPDPAFGQGGYALTRVAPNVARDRCLEEGVDFPAAQGTWYGGPGRDGEGLMIDVLDAEHAVVTWYTYRAGAQPAPRAR